MIGWTSIALAGAWTPAELGQLTLGPAGSLAVAPYDGALALFVAGEDGVRIVDPTTAVERARSSLRGTLWVGDQVLVCGESGVARVEGPRLTDAPCERVVAVERGLVTVAAGRVSTPSGVDLPVIAALSGHLAASGDAVLVEDALGHVQQVVGDTITPFLADRPVVDLVGLPPADGIGRFAALLRGDGFVLRLPTGDLAIDGTATGLVVSGGELWVTDGPGKRLGAVLDGAIAWSRMPVAPELAVAADLDGDGCLDLIVSDRAGSAARVVGLCGEVAVTVARTPVRAAPAALEIGGPWSRLEVRVGDELTTRIVDPEGRQVRWSSRGGPPGFSVARDGAITYRPTAADVGRWRISVRATRGLASWSGLELRVWPSDGTVAVP